MRLENPYLSEIRKKFSLTDQQFSMFSKGEGLSYTYHKNIGSYTQRSDLVVKYSWAIPNERVIRRIAEFTPILEMGAGSGYWAYLLSQAGAEVFAYDNLIRNPHIIGKWFKVKRGSFGKMKLHPNKALLLCWPPYNSDMASKYLSLHKGRIIIYVGEEDSGCTANTEFHERLAHKKDFKLLENIQIPTWPGLHDSVFIYERIKP